MYLQDYLDWTECVVRTDDPGCTDYQESLAVRERGVHLEERGCGAYQAWRDPQDFRDPQDSQVSPEEHTASISQGKWLYPMLNS